jgi:tetratricopeptide (TPR) repeat protein/DNA-binding SARP family transcriptional activator
MTVTETVAPLDFWLGGQLRMRVGTEVTSLRPTRLHEIMALLLLRANTPVALSDIAASVWPDRRSIDEEDIRSYIAKLRRLLAHSGIRLVSATRRYRLELDPMRVDVLKFGSLLASADQAADPAEQRRLVDLALAVCPTDALLSDFTRAWVLAARTDHGVQWNEAALRRNRYWLRDGLHDRLLSVLRRAEVHRSMDQLWVHDYLLALYRTGFVQDALAHYTALTRLLQADGTPVRARLRTLGDAIRRQDPALDQPEVRLIATAPDTLPPHVVELAGRRAEMRHMQAHADARAHDTVRVIGIYGPPGIGKTALATSYAHRHKARYPGGVLFADLGGYGPAGRQDVDSVLARFLGALGIGREHLPLDHATRLDRYRDLTRRRALLVVLDNAASTEAAAVLLPCGPGSLAIVTSRTRLTALTSRHGALPIVLDRIDEPAAIEVLNGFIGGRPDHHPGVVRDIARGCAGHPLALCLAGARLATRPEEPLAEVAEMLSAQRIGTLDRYAEPGDAVADVFSWSYRRLEPMPARVWRALGQSPCASLDIAAIGCLTGVDPATLRPVLADLEASHLLTLVGAGRYAMADLLAEYATALAAQVDSARSRTAALDRLYEYHDETAHAAAHRLWPAEVPAPAPAAAPAAGIVADPDLARRWLDEHRDDLLAAAHHEAGFARPGHVLGLAACLFRYLDHGGHLDQAVQLNRMAVGAAHRLGADAQRASALGRLGAVLVRCGQLAEAETSLTAAYSIHERLGDRRGQAVALGNLGRVAARRGAFVAATAHQEAALALFRTCRDRLAEARTLTNLGIVCEARGELDVALAHHETARAICAEIEAPDALARSLGSTAGVLRAKGRLAEARQRYEEAIEQFRALGDRIGEATTLTNLGLVRMDQGVPGAASELHTQALDAFEEIGDVANAIETLNSLGGALLAAGRSIAARHRHEDALNRAEQLGNRAETARAHAGLAAVRAQEAAQATGTGREQLVTLIREHVREATDQYGEIGVEPPAALVALADRFGAG